MLMSRLVPYSRKDAMEERVKIYQYCAICGKEAVTYVTMEELHELVGAHVCEEHKDASIDEIMAADAD